MMAMVKQYLRDGSGNATFLYGEKTQEDVMYRETLDQLEAEYENLTVVYSLSDEDWSGRTGHVQAHIGDVVPDPEATDFYCCGVPGMVVETTEKLADIGVPDERWGTVGKAVVQGDDSLTLDDLSAFLDDRLARFKHPRHLAFVDELPTSGPSKIDRDAVREEFGESAEGSDE